MKSKRPEQVELPFKPTEFQLDLLVGKTPEAREELQFFSSRNCQLESKTQPATDSTKAKKSPVEQDLTDSDKDQPQKA